MDITTLSNEQLLQLARDNVASFPQNENLYDPNEAAYLRGLYSIATHGRVKMSRPGQATISMPGTRAEFDLTDGKIPLLRSKKIFFRSFLIENQWFLSGSDDVAFLKERNVSIWDSWVIPSTAVFEPTEKQTGFDVETYIRCHYPEVFKALVKYKAKMAISIPTFAQMQDFIASYTNQFAELNEETVQLGNIPKVRLAGGKIGAGAYGPAWRKWEDVRLRMDRPVGNEHKALLARGFKSVSEDALIDDSDPMAWGDFYSRVIDQFGDAIKMLRTGADSRRIIVSAWNAAKIDEAALPPCHSWFQFVSYDNFDGGPRDLVCVLMQRSADHPCGTPFNVAQYAALTHLVAKITNHRAVKLVLNIGDDHIYADQVPLLKEQFNRTPIGLPCATMRIPDSVKELDDFINLPEDELIGMIHGYEEGSYHPRIDYPVAV